MYSIETYRPAKLYNGGGDLKKEWYVEFYCLNPATNELQRFKERFNINRIHSRQERTRYGRAMVEFLNEKLKEGFSPFKDRAIAKFGSQYHIQAQLYKLQIELSEEGTPNSKASFLENYNRFCKFLSEKDYGAMLMEQFSMEHAKEYRRYLREKELSRKTINSSLSYMSNYWRVAIEKDWAHANPFVSVPRIKKHQVSQTEREKDPRFEPLNSDEMVKVFTALLEGGQRNFVRYLGMIYYGWARPSEIARLRVNDVDLDRGLIRFRKFNTKNQDAAYIQIVPPLKNLLVEMNLASRPGSDLLFALGFEPGLVKLRKNGPSEFWREKIKDPVSGLGINKDMYALKHTGNIEYLLRNKGKTDLKWQQCQNRHSSSAMTERYNRKLGAYFIDLEGMDFRLFE